MPHTVQLNHDHGDEGLAVVSVSFDDPEDKDSVLAILGKQNAEFENVIAIKDGKQSFAGIEGVPQYQLYDRFGLLRYQFSPDPSQLQFGEPTEQLDQRVKELLAE